MLTRRTVLIGLAATPCRARRVRALAAPCPAPTRSQTSAGDLTIQPLNHATLILSQGGHVFYFDPAKVDFSGRPPATAIFITHEHPDHFDPDNLSKIAGKAQIVATQSVADKIPAALKDQVTVMKNGDSATIDGIPVSAVAAYNTSPDKAPVSPQGNRQRLRADLRRQEDLCRRRHREHAGNGGADRDRRGVPAHEPALYDDARAGGRRPSRPSSPRSSTPTTTKAPTRKSSPTSSATPLKSASATGTPSPETVSDSFRLDSRGLLRR